MGPGKTLKERSEEQLKSKNPGQIGDPTSLKAEGSERVPKESEAGAKKEGHKTLKHVAQETNPTMLGDHVSLKAEKSDSEPTKEDRGALKQNKRESKI